MKWYVRVVGKLPEELEVEADTKDEAENEALNEICNGFEMKVEPVPAARRLFVVARKAEERNASHG